MTTPKKAAPRKKVAAKPKTNTPAKKGASASRKATRAPTRSSSRKATGSKGSTGSAAGKKQPSALKKPTQANIREICGELADKRMVIVNTQLNNNGYSKITAKQRNAALKKVDNNQQPKKKVPQRTNRGGPGGKRAGAGRKVSSTTRKTRAIADKMVEDGELTPLEFMLQTMRETPDDLRKQHKSGKIDTAEFVIRMRDLIDRRYAAAKDAAPYLHPRLASIEAKVDSSGQEHWLAIMEEMGV